MTYFLPGLTSYLACPFIYFKSCLVIFLIFPLKESSVRGVGISDYRENSLKERAFSTIKKTTASSKFDPHTLLLLLVVRTSSSL